MEGAGLAASDGYAPDDGLPKSTSSAMPDLSSPSVPVLKARVHRRLTAAQCVQIPLSALRFRPLQAEDFEEMVALHTEWFPVSYDEAFYQKSVLGEIFTLVATLSSQSEAASSSSQGSQAASSSSRGSQSQAGTSSSVVDEDLLGIITMSTSCEHHCDDIVPVLGADCATVCKKNLRLKDPAIAEEDGIGNAPGCLAYILTLGVTDGFRRRGLARELLKRAIAQVSRDLPQVQAVYLHVVTYNEAAIQLYESSSFTRISRFTSFYYLHGKPYDSFLYALYVNSGRPPWKWRLRNFLGLDISTTWRDWVVSAWSSFWRAETLTEKPVPLPPPPM